MKMLTQLTDFTDQVAIVRAGFDVPLQDGKVADTSRIKAMIPTITYITERGGSVVLIAHQGRPDGRDPEFSQRPLVPVLEELLGTSVEFCEDCTTAELNLEPGAVVLCENLRYYKGEKSKDPTERMELAEAIAKHGTMYVNDAFTNCHRAHASMVELAKCLPAYAGLSLEQELKHLGSVLGEHNQPIAFIVAGAKIETKVPVIRQCLHKAQFVLTGGIIANTFLVAAGKAVGDSKIDDEAVEIAKELLAEAEASGAEIVLPVDACTAMGMDDQHPTNQTVPFESGIAFDIGTKTQEHYAQILQSVQTIIWNGPVGMYENPLYANGSFALAQAILQATKAGAHSIIGGGDTIDFWNQNNLPLADCTFVSMGGGAMLSLLASDPMPALDALEG